jgi:hypothetical protein
VTVVGVSDGGAKRSGDRGGGGIERRSVGGKGGVVEGLRWRDPANTSWQRIDEHRLCPVRGFLQPLHCAVGLLQSPVGTIQRGYLRELEFSLLVQSLDQFLEGLHLLPALPELAVQ